MGGLIFSSLLNSWLPDRLVALNRFLPTDLVQMIAKGHNANSWASEYLILLGVGFPALTQWKLPVFSMKNYKENCHET